MCLEEIMVKYVQMAVDKLMESSRTQGFESFKNSMKEIFHKGVGEAFDELKDGFKNEEQDVMAWIQYNLTEYNKAQVPPNQQMIAMMKTQQQMAMVKGAYQSYLDGKKKPEEAPVAVPV
jgi:hypothetical protein